MITRSNEERPPVLPQHGKAVHWRKSSWSATNGNCVEVALLRGGRVAVRDSKNADDPVLTFSVDAWSSFLSSVRERIRG